MFIISALLILVFIVMAIAPSLFTNADPRACNLRNSLELPSAEHWFGFDLQGCDYVARTVYGAQVSISIGIIVTVFAVLIALVLGSLAGYYGGFSTRSSPGSPISGLPSRPFWAASSS